MAVSTPAGWLNWLPPSYHMTLNKVHEKKNKQLVATKNYMYNES